MSFVKPCRVAAFFAVCLLSVFAPTAQAVPVTFQSIMSGDWNNGLTWDQLGAVPDADDVVIISDNTIVTVTQTSDVAGSVSFSPISFGASLQIANGAKLTVSGDVSISDGGFANATLNAGDGNLVVTGKIHIYEGINGGVGKLAIGSGNVSCANLLVTTTNAADTQIAFSGPGVLSLRGSMDSSAQLSNFTGGGGSTVKFAGTAAQVVGNYVYQNLTIANTAASVVANGTFTVNGKLDVQSASTFIVRNGFNAGTAAALQMSGTSLLRLGDEVVSFNVVMPDFASYTLAAASTISYSANVAQTVNPDVPYQHLEVSFLGSAGTPIKTMGGDTTVLGDLKIEQTGTGTVTLDVGTSVVTVAGNLTGDGGLAFLSGGELRLAGDFSNIGAFSGGSGTFVYNGGQFQNVRPLPYNNLYITGTNTNATLSSNGGAAATLKVDADSYFDLNTTFTVTDTLRVNGVVNGTGDTLTVSSSASPIEGSGAIYAHVNVGSRSIASTAALLFGGNVTIGTSQTVTNNGAVTILNSVNGSLATWINAANSSLTVAGNVMPNGTLAASANPNTVSYNGLGQTVAAGTYHHLIFTTTPIATPGVKTMPVSALTINGDFTIAGASNVTATNAINVAGGFTLDDTATFSAGSFTHSVMGDWSISGGTFTPANSTLLFNGGG
ncbi:MAG TPA: hypothetical protein VE010_01590, partial [Thermoanaerobaculia bacterium]|nr:hypothetical protein [Thermoanaerobaculia bacterium]